MKCEDCKNSRAKGPPTRIRMTVVKREEYPDFDEHVGESIERTVCQSCLRFRKGLSFLKVEELETVAKPAGRKVRTGVAG